MTKFKDACKVDAWKFIRRLERGNTLTIGDVKRRGFTMNFA